MTKADLVEEVIRVAALSKKDAETVVNTVFDQVVEALRRDDKIELRGFGSFRVRRRRSRQGRNMRRNAPMAVVAATMAATKARRFAPSGDTNEVFDLGALLNSSSVGASSDSSSGAVPARACGCTSVPGVDGGRDCCFCVPCGCFSVPPAMAGRDPEASSSGGRGCSRLRYSAR